MWAMLPWIAVFLLLAAILLWAGLRQLLHRADGRKVVLVVLGSGGHTTEILSMLGALDVVLRRGIVFVVAETDKMSQQRAAHLFPHAPFIKTPRAREVHQSWLTTVITTFVASLHAVKLVFQQQPDLASAPRPAAYVLRTTFLGLAVFVN
jgi:beta-1,4-N-acetylglucosaminyltransferase